MVLGMAPSSAERRCIVQVPGVFYVNDHLKSLMFDELQQYVTKGGFGGFLPGMKQLANVAGLPGIVSVSRYCMCAWQGACVRAGPLHPCGRVPLPHCFAQKSIALPDVHSGYGFAIGNVAACTWPVSCGCW